MALWAIKRKENLSISINISTLKIEWNFLLRYYASILSEALKQVYNTV